MSLFILIYQNLEDEKKLKLSFTFLWLAAESVKMEEEMEKKIAPQITFLWLSMGGQVQVHPHPYRKIRKYIWSSQIYEETLLIFTTLWGNTSDTFEEIYLIKIWTQTVTFTTSIIVKTSSSSSYWTMNKPITFAPFKVISGGEGNAIQLIWKTVRHCHRFFCISHDDQHDVDVDCGLWISTSFWDFFVKLDFVVTVSSSSEKWILSLAVSWL